THVITTEEARVPCLTTSSALGRGRQGTLSQGGDLPGVAHFSVPCRKAIDSGLVRMLEGAGAGRRDFRAAKPQQELARGGDGLNAAIVIEGVTKRFGRIVAVSKLDLQVPRGSLYGFIGPNGSGKSTTLRMIMHILLPDEGAIEVLGQRDTRAAHDRVSYLPE